MNVVAVQALRAVLSARHEWHAATSTHRARVRTTAECLAVRQQRQDFHRFRASTSEIYGHNRAAMTQPNSLPVAIARRDFRRLLELAEHGQRTVILRHGRSVAELGRVHTDRPDLPVARRPGGLVALLGTLGDWNTMETDIDVILVKREGAADRPAPELE